MTNSFAWLVILAGSVMGTGAVVVLLIWRALTPTEAQSITEAERRAAADREAAFRRGVAAERAAVLRLLRDIQANLDCAEGLPRAVSKDGLSRIVDVIVIGDHAKSRRIA